MLQPHWHSLKMLDAHVVVESSAEPHEGLLDPERARKTLQARSGLVVCTFVALASLDKRAMLDSGRRCCRRQSENGQKEHRQAKTFSQHQR